MIEKDEPITTGKDDALGRGAFAKQLAEILDDYHFSYGVEGRIRSSLVIGLEGVWGSGKTSFFHLLEENLKQQHFAVEWFNSWLAVDRASLIQLFFDALAEGAEKTTPLGQTAKQIKEIAAWILSAVDSLRPLAGALVGENAGEAVNAFCTLLKEPQKEEKPTFVQRKKKLEESFRKNSKWLVFFVDDIDRLSDKDIALTFQLIKNIADFPKIIYILAYDREVVSSALERVQRKRGAEYLQKVVQVPIPLPEPEPAQIEQFLYEKIWKLVGEEAGTPRFHSLFQMLCAQYLVTLRDVKRVANALEWSCAACGKDCDAGDILTMTVLGIYEPELREFIRGHKLEMMGWRRNAPECSASQEEMDALAREMNAEFSLEAHPTLRRILAELFPDFAARVKWPCGDEGGNRMRNPRRICQLDSFDRYFRMALPSTAVSSEQIRRVFQMETADEIRAVVGEWIRAGKLDSFFQQAGYVCRTTAAFGWEIKSWMPHFLEGFSAAEKGNEGRAETSFSEDRWHDFLQGMLENALRNSEKPGQWKAETLQNLFSSPGISLSILWDLLWVCGRGQDWIFGGGVRGQEPPVIKDEVFQKLLEMLLHRLEENAQEPVKLFRERNCSYLLSIWQWQCEQKGSGACQAFLQSAEEGFPCLLRCLVCVQPVRSSVSGTIKGWQWAWNAGEILPKNLAEEMTEKFASQFWKDLQEREKQRCAIFFALKEKEKETQEGITFQMEISDEMIHKKWNELVLGVISVKNF